MKSSPEIHFRKSTRLKDFDYSQPGGYFVTIVAHLRQNIFGEVQVGKMSLNDAGLMVQVEWENLSKRFPSIDLDIFQVMPNHFHGIVLINEPPVGAGLVPANEPHVGAGLVPAHEIGVTTRVAPTLGKIVGAFKSITTHKYIRGVDEFSWPAFDKRLWQRNYYEHILRDQADYERIAGYILANPANWDGDEENLSHLPPK